MTKIKVLIVDDSPLIRDLFAHIFGSDPAFEVVGMAENPLIARTMIKEKNPDVLTLDIEMPEMDGISFLRKIMSLRPMPVIMVSTLTQKGAEATMEALEIGAIDYVAKPANLNDPLSYATFSQELLSKVKAAAKVSMQRYLAPKTLHTPAALPLFKKLPLPLQLIAIGSSTGGVEAVKDILCTLPPDMPPIVVTQHMLPSFTAAFTNRLNSCMPLTVIEGTDNLLLKKGHVYIAQGDSHMEIVRKADGLYTRLSTEPAISGHRPSVDALFHSVARAAPGAALGIILTGMGKDGAEGLFAMHKTGALTIGQNEETCVVYGMPRAAKQLGAVDQELPLLTIAEAIKKIVKG